MTIILYKIICYYFEVQHEFRSISTLMAVWIHITSTPCNYFSLLLTYCYTWLNDHSCVPLWCYKEYKRTLKSVFLAVFYIKCVVIKHSIHLESIPSGSLNFGIVWTIPPHLELRTFIKHATFLSLCYMLLVRRKFTGSAGRSKPSRQLTEEHSRICLLQSPKKLTNFPVVGW